MIQAMQILQLPTLDLAERIQQELIENPFLEVVQETPGEGEGPQPAAAEPASEASSDREGADREGIDGMLEILERYERDFGDGSRGRAPTSEDSDRRYEAMQNAPAHPKSLPRALLDELAFLRISEEEREVLEYLVWSLDEHGYLGETPEEIAAEISAQHGREVEQADVEVALARLRQATHPAMGAKDLRDCLLLQLAQQEEVDPLVRAIVSDHLHDIEANRLPRISKVTGHSLEEVKQAIEALRHLDPVPAAGFGEASAEVITPDVVVEELEGQYTVRLERERTPELAISPIYRKLLQQAQRGDGVRDWVKQRLESARWFIEALHQRQSTLQRIAESIFKRQRGFLERGLSGLVPLRMQEVADEIGVHISTVSRGVSGKYVQTPRGIHPLKFFFTGGTAKATGEVTSQVSILERVKEIVAAEEPTQPLSDDQIAARLGEQDGIQIARRTISKYRKMLSIPSSAQRRAY